jgi:hypothetical protein
MCVITFIENLCSVVWKLPSLSRKHQQHAPHEREVCFFKFKHAVILIPREGNFIWDAPPGIDRELVENLLAWLANINPGLREWQGNLSGSFPITFL